ncbi:Yip1 family protein [Streptomyces sp. NPDC092296]|uniref:Yip1 family protein n=1 Tax=Streptomyces sp. NPDC092296 TaxID=3366012 RepID=UPI00381067F8
MAGNGYDNGRGTPRQGRGRAPQQYGGVPATPPAGGLGGYDGAQQQPGPAPYGHGPQGGGPYPGRPTGEPEYFGGAPAADPYPRYDDNPGHTRAFTTGGDAYGGQGGFAPPPEADHVAVYRAGSQVGPHLSGPRPHWRELLVGIYRDPARTFDRMREHQAWLPMLTVSLVYGVLAVLGFGDTRSEVLNATFSVALWSLFGAAVAFLLAGAMLGGVTYGLARQFGGDGPWQSTVGLSALIAWTTDAPRLLFALFLPADGMFVQLLGWASWVFCTVLMTIMVRRVHDLPWGKAAGAAAVQLIALLILIKLPTLS